MSEKIENKIGELVYKRIEELQNFQGDLKELSPESGEKLEASFMRHGNIAPVFIWESNILDGRQRIRTLLRLRNKGVAIPEELPCVKIKAESEKEAKRFLLQYVSQQGRVTEDGLYAFLNEADLQDELAELKLELDIPSLDCLDLDAFEEEYFNNSSDGDREDEVPGVPRKARSKEGDLYELGKHRVLCGDATKKEDIEKLMAGQKAKLCFTSPPYNMAGKMYQNYNDNLKSQEYIDFNLRVIKNIRNVLHGFLFWNISYNKNAKWEWIEIFYRITKETGLKFLEKIVWDKGHGTPITSSQSITRQYEDILFAGTEADIEADLTEGYIGTTLQKYKFNKRTQKGITNYWRITTGNTQLEEHKACYPVALPVKAILLMTETGEIMIDPFVGSGTSLIGGEKTGRICYGMDSDPLYIDVTVQRHVDYTQNRKIKLNGREITWEDIDRN